ncbi:MAG: hypothetical protein PHW13_08605 [Methylococcales bacterium]|nr:hypothetical protein [Methylococcales bacterium]
MFQYRISGSAGIWLPNSGFDFFIPLTASLFRWDSMQLACQVQGNYFFSPGYQAPAARLPPPRCAFAAPHSSTLYSGLIPAPDQPAFLILSLLPASETVCAEKAYRGYYKIFVVFSLKFLG